MTKRDEEDLGLALVSGGFGALLGYGQAKPKIQQLEVQNRDLHNEVAMLRNTISAQNSTIAILQEENSKLKKEQKKDKTSVKGIAKSLFHRI